LRPRGDLQAAGGLEHAADLGEQAGGVGHVLEHLGAPHEVRRSRLQRDLISHRAEVRDRHVAAGALRAFRAAYFLDPQSARGPSDYLEAARAARGQP
jgi:hypothetical protein